MGWFRKFVYFCVQVDRDELENLGAYDRTLIYASFLRQILGALFVFAIFLYAWSILLPLWIAITISALLAAIVFFIDQAIIASEWMFHRDFFRAWILNAPANFVFKILQLLPRILYAVVIAAFMSTLAEITIQSRAIERSLRETTREANQEYFSRKDTLQAEQKTAIDEIEAEIVRLEAAIALSSDPNIQQSIEVLNSNTELAAEEIEILSARQVTLREDQSRLTALVADLSGKVEAARGRVTFNEEQMRLESTAERCRSPGTTACQQANWQRFRDAKRRAETELGTHSTDLEGAETQLQAVRQQIQSTRTALGAANTDFSSVSGRLREVQATSEDLPELQSELTTQVALLDQTEKSHAEALSALETELRATGYYEEADYGPLELYVGLKRLHNPPVPQDATEAEITKLALEGEAAREFSNGLWYVIFLFELSPVLVAFLAAPFSHLGLKMRRKRDDAQREDLADRLQKDHDIQEKYATERVYQAKSRQDMRAELKAHRRTTKLREAQDKEQYNKELRTISNQRKQDNTQAKLDRSRQRTEAKAENAVQSDKNVLQSRRDQELLDREIKKQRQKNELQELRHQHQFGEELVPDGAEQPSAKIRGGQNV